MPENKKKTFLQHLKVAAPKDLRGKPYDIASEFIEKFGKDEFCYSDLSAAIEIMGKMKKSHAKSDLQFKFKEKVIITSEFLLEKIIPWVEETREKVFGSPKPPFDWEGAVKWIENEAKRSGKIKSEEEAEELMNRMGELTREFREYYFYPDFLRRPFPYAKRGEKWIYNEIVNSPNLEFLELETRRMAKITGFSQAALVIHVLSGLKIVVSRLQISTSISSHALSKQETLSGKEINLKIRARDFTFRELWSVYQKIKKEINLEKDRPLKGKHLQIYVFVKRLGKPPERGEPGHYRFWYQAEKKWNDKYPEDKYSGWQGLRGAFERIIAILERIYIS